MTATLTISRTNLSLADLVIGSDYTTGYTLDPALKIGDVTWRKRTEESDDVAGRQLIGYVRETSQASGSITIHGSSETDHQTKLGVLITALTQVDPTAGFQPFTMTYTHGAAVYSWTCTEPADCVPNDDDMEKANLMLSVSWAVVRDPIPLAGPI